MRLDGSVVIVTGASRGVGAATAKQLAARGANVLVNVSKSVAEAEAVAETCRAQGVSAIVCRGDVAADDDCRAIAAAAMAEWGRIDGLVNNAAATAFCAHADLEGMASDDFQRILAVNTLGPFQMTRAVAPHMKAAGTGAIVNVSSVAGLYGIGSCLGYVASKGGLNMLTVALARALGPEIKVNAVCPGFIEGDWLRQGMGDQRYDSVKTKLESGTPLRSVNSPDDVADNIIWLLEGATNITGQTFTIDSGMSLMIGGVPTPRR